MNPLRRFLIDFVIGYGLGFAILTHLAGAAWLIRSVVTG